MLQAQGDSHKLKEYCHFAPRAAMCFQGNTSFLDSCTHLEYMPWTLPVWLLGCFAFCLMRLCLTKANSYQSSAIIKSMHHKEISVGRRCQKIQSQGAVVTYFYGDKMPDKPHKRRKEFEGGWLRD